MSALQKSSSDEERTRLFVKDFLITQLQGADVNDIWQSEQTPMDQLVKILSERGESAPEPRLCNASAVNTILAAYRVGLYDSKKEMIGIGWGESVEIATDVAARDALQRLYQTRTSMPSFDFSSRN